MVSPRDFKVIRTTDARARPDMRIVVADDLEKLDDPLAGRLKISAIARDCREEGVRQQGFQTGDDFRSAPSVGSLPLREFAAMLGTARGGSVWVSMIHVRPGSGHPRRPRSFRRPLKEIRE